MVIFMKESVLNLWMENTASLCGNTALIYVRFNQIQKSNSHETTVWLCQHSVSLCVHVYQPPGLYYWENENVFI